MDLINEKVKHNTFGEGYISEQNEASFTVDFNDNHRRFVYPDAIGKFIILQDEETASKMEKVIAKIEKKEAILEKEREKEQERLALKQQHRRKLRDNKIHESSQIVFWIDEEEKETIFDNWEVSTGEIQSGKNKGQPNRPARLRANSAGVLTLRSADEEETNRKIVGIYMISETFVGELNEDGTVPPHSEFKVKLSDEEAEKMLFWNYYINKNYPHRMTWNSGRYRYFDNEWTAQILRDIIALKTDEEEIKALEEFLQYFCNMNAIDKDNIPEAGGALKVDNEEEKEKEEEE